MKIMQRIAMLVLPAFMLLPGISNANVMRPALDIQDFALDAGASVTATSFDIEATAFTIVTTGAPIDIADTTFTLTSTSGSYDIFFGMGTFGGDINVGSLLTATFTQMNVINLGADYQFFGDVTYTGGSLAGNLQGGRIEGVFTETGAVVAKLGPVSAVPVPAAAWLFGSGLIGLAGIARRKA